MGHFAKVVEGIVVEVIVARQSFIDSLPNTPIVTIPAQPYNEAYADTVVPEPPKPHQWFKTSYNTYESVHYAPDSDIPDDKPPLRGNFAGIGYTYDAINDVFYAPQSYSSWILNTTTWQWEAPIKMPTTKGTWIWDEPTISWILETTSVPSKTK